MWRNRRKSIEATINLNAMAESCLCQPIEEEAANLTMAWRSLSIHRSAVSMQ